MCMITYVPVGIPVPSDGIYRGGTFNDDGHGWAVAADTGVMLIGRFMSLDAALDTFEVTRNQYPEAPALFHSRWATHGVTDVRNVHPFHVGKYSVVAHNGILPQKFHPTKDDLRSDTAILASEFLPGRAQVSGVYTRKARRSIGRIIGTGNKLCILSVSPFLERPRAYLVNSGQGVWDKETGAWFSNHDFEGRKWNRHALGTYSGWWDDVTPNRTKGDDDATVIGTKAVELFGSRVCPVCHTNENIANGFCLACAFCLDCGEATDNCSCYVPASNNQGTNDAWMED